MPDFHFHPLTPDRWDDLERLFGARGATGGCWCMYFHSKQSDYERMKGEGNRQAFRGLVQAGPPPGILAYAGTEPAGWCAVAPRTDYDRLARSRILAPVDDRPVWSVVCFFVGRQYRRQGLTSQLLRAALDYARQNGAQLVEGYPVEPQTAKMPDVFAFTGVAETFRQVGFVEVARRSPTRPLMRYEFPTE